MLLYISWIVKFLGFINTKISNKHKLLSLSNLHLLFYQPLPFWGKLYPPQIFWRMNRTPILIQSNFRARSP